MARAAPCCQGIGLPQLAAAFHFRPNGQLPTVVASQARAWLEHRRGTQLLVDLVFWLTQVLIDLNGWTAGHRSDILSLRAAPIQAVFLGYPATTGAAYMDYMITDVTVSPPDLARHYSEALVLVPGCYYTNDHARYHAKEARDFAAAGAPGSPSRDAYVHAQRREAGLPAAATLVANFNQLYKITPDVFDAWMRAVAGETKASFWQPLPLAAPGASAQQGRMRQRARVLGVREEQLVFTNTTNIVEFVRRCGLADLVLDTYPVSAHTVAMDVLWMGTPLLTRPGESFASRVASSVLGALGLSGMLLARSPADYTALAARLLRGPGAHRRRLLLRRTIETRRDSYPLFDRHRQAALLELASRLMFELHAAGLARRHLVLAAPSSLRNRAVPK